MILTTVVSVVNVPAGNIKANKQQMRLPKKPFA
jgi:hypothetical protein